MLSWKKLGECCNLEKGATPIQKAIPGEYPLVVTSPIRRSCNTYQFDKPSVCVPLVSSRGHGVASLNQVFYQEGKFALGNILCSVTPYESDLNARYLYYYLNTFKDSKIVPLMTGGANVSLTVKKLSTVRICYPSLFEQERIVSILDTFTASIANLKAQIKERRKQYEYYRDQLLDLEGKDGVEMKKIKDVCLNICSGGTPSTSHKEYYSGDIPWLRTQEVDWKEIYDTEIKITEEAIENSSAKIIPANCVIVAMYGATAAKVAINRIPLSTNQACCNLQIDTSQVMIKFVYQWLCKEYLNLKALGEGSQNNINGKKVKDYSIPIPSKAEQLRIVNILDQFESSIANLEAQLKEREKQYEYYRNQLLTFE